MCARACKLKILKNSVKCSQKGGVQCIFACNYTSVILVRTDTLWYRSDLINSDVDQYYTSINIKHNSSSYLILLPISLFSADNEQLFVTTYDAIVMAVFLVKSQNRNILCLAIHCFKLVFT